MPCTIQGYWYYISFLEERTRVIDIEALKFKDDALAEFKNYKALREKQSGCQLKIFHIDGGGEYMGEFVNCHKENAISYEVSAFYSPKQNGKAKRANCSIMRSDRGIFAQQRLFKSL